MTDFQQLYSRYSVDIYRFALYLCGDAADAEDITAETFVRVMTGKTPLISATVKGYLLTIARNLYLESLRRRRRMAAFPAELPDAGALPEQVAGDRTELEALRTHLQRYPEADRTALLLRSEGLSYEEIATALDISLASAKVKVHRLRLKLAEWRARREETHI